MKIFKTVFIATVIALSKPVISSSFHPFDYKIVKKIKKRSSQKPSLNKFFFEIWRNGFSLVDGPKCPHYPTCSHFFHQSLSRYHLHSFYFLASRLLEEIDTKEINGYHPLKKFYGVWRIYDPVESYVLQSKKIKKNPHYLPLLSQYKLTSVKQIPLREIW